MADRGRKHDWRLNSIWGSIIPRCGRCGLLGKMEVIVGTMSAGWCAKPIYGCTTEQESDNGYRR